MTITETSGSKHSPSICIPYTFKNTNWIFVKEVFEKLFDSNCVKKIDIVNKQNKNNISYNCIFIHLTKWPSSEIAESTRKKLINGEAVNVVYDFPLYWKCYASKY